jgi:hypothetical protein
MDQAQRVDVLDSLLQPCPLLCKQGLAHLSEANQPGLGEVEGRSPVQWVEGRVGIASNLLAGTTGTQAGGAAAGAFGADGAVRV